MPSEGSTGELLDKKFPFVLGPLIVAALAAGGLAGAGVGLGWYPPVVGVGAAVLIGLGTGVVVFRRARLARRVREGAGK